VAKKTILAAYSLQTLGLPLPQHDRSRSEQRGAPLSQPAGRYDSPERHRRVSQERAALETCTCRDSEQGRTALRGGRHRRVCFTASLAGAGPSQAASAVFPTGAPAPALQTGLYAHPRVLPNGRGVCRAQLGAAELQDGVTAVSQQWINVPSQPLESFCVCSFPDFSPYNFVLSLTFWHPLPFQELRMPQAGLHANTSRRREGGEAPALCPVTTKAGV